jgi:hypothetical protein
MYSSWENVSVALSFISRFYLAHCHDGFELAYPDAVTNKRKICLLVDTRANFHAALTSR